MVWLWRNKSIILGIIPLFASLLFLRTNGLVHKPYSDPKAESLYQDLFKQNENPDDFALGFVNMAFFGISIGILILKTIMGDRYHHFIGDTIFAVLSLLAYQELTELVKTSDIWGTLTENKDWTIVTTYVPITMCVSRYLFEISIIMIQKVNSNVSATAV